MKAFCLLNHNLTSNQINELYDEFDVGEIIYPSADISEAWAQIPSKKELNLDIIMDICKWLQQASMNDVLLIQGEFGSTFMLVDYALKNNLIPVYAVSKRVAQEKRVGEIVHRQYIFQHVCFRKYKYFA